MRKPAINRQEQKHNHEYKPRNHRTKWRFYLAATFLMLCIFGLAFRMFQLSILERGFLLKQSNARVLRQVNIPANRGMITDRNGVPLAVSTPVDSVWANPHMFVANTYQLDHLAKLLHSLPTNIEKRIDANPRLQFVYLKRGIVPQTVAKVKAFKIPGVFFQRGFRRYYPEGPVMAHVLGFTNIDDQGQEGLELAYNKWLAGSPGKKEVVKDRLGQIVADVDVIKEPDQGQNLVLSIDSRIQYLAYRELLDTVNKFHAVSGSVVVLNDKTGEILAMVNVPSYNPNQRPKIHDSRYRNRAVTDVFEPGSTMKAFSVANALDSGKYTPKSIINTSPGWIVIDGNKIQDDVDNGVINVTQVLQKSSNVGVAKITLSLPPTSLWNLLHSVGFGERTHSGFPGETSGVLLERRIWRPTDLATLSFGYGISVTALQLAHAYAIIANGGIKVPVTFLKRMHPVQGVRAIKAKTAKEMLTMLQTVLQPGGTGTRGRVPNYIVAGKTGTAYIAGHDGYYKNRYTASFVGIAPASNPQLVVAVVIHDVQGKRHFGGQVAAPAFAAIMSGALRFLNIPPDDLNNDLNNDLKKTSS